MEADTLSDGPPEILGLTPGPVPYRAGDLLGEEAPEQRPALFVPGIVSTLRREHSSPAFSPSGDRLLWTEITDRSRIRMSVLREGLRGPPQVAPWSGFFSDFYPSFSADGRTVFFSSYRLWQAGAENPGWRVTIWDVDRLPEGWGEPGRQTPPTLGADPMLINGMLGGGEWDHAAEVNLGWDTRLLLKEDGLYLYLAVFSPSRRHTGLDLYLADADGPRIRLHVSEALGDAPFLDGRWGEMRWGENRGWTANMIGGVVEEGVTRFLAPEAFEFQIDLELLGPEPWYAFVHLKRPELMLPEAASLEDPHSWAVLDLTADFPPRSMPGARGVYRTGLIPCPAP